MSTDSLPLASAPRSLRLFQAPLPSETEPPGSTLDVCLRLTELFEGWYLPDVLSPQGVSRETVTSYRESLAWWKRLVEDPPILDIRSRDFASFSSQLQQQKGRKAPLLSPATVHKHCSQVGFVLRWAGPHGEDDRDGLILLDRVPKSKSPPVPEPIVDPLEYGELVQILGACSRLRLPRLAAVVPVADWWRAFIVVCYYEGFRLETMLKLEFGWLREQVIRVPRTAVKRKKSDLVTTLHDDSFQAIQRIRGDRALIFPWPYCETYLQTCRKKLWRLAGLAPSRMSWSGFHAIRKAHGTELAGINPMAAQLSLGHADMATTQRHYTQRKVMAEGKAKMRRLPRRADSAQRTLFE